LATVSSLVEAMSNAHVSRPRVGEGCLFREFWNHHFPPLDGTGGYLGMENWLKDIEELLEATNYTKENKVIYTVYKLYREAKR
jgi:hypothetical protein